MPYCTVCKIETDYEYDIALSNGEYLHYSCILMLQMQKHEIETAYGHRTHNSFCRSLCQLRERKKTLPPRPRLKTYARNSRS